MEKQSGEIFNQLLSSLEDAEEKFEKAYKKKKYEEFAKSKKIIIDIQNKIMEMIK